MAGAEVQTTPVAEPDPGAPARIGLGCLPGQLWDPSYRRALAWVAPLVVLAYGFAMTNFTLAGDDWFALYPQATLDTHYSLVAGRWMMPVTWWIMGNGSFVPFFTFAVALVLLVLAGLIACATWGFRRSWAVLAVVALFVVNPMFTDTLSFKQHHLSFTIGLVCATAAGWVLLRWRGGRMWRVAAAATLLVVSLASYQPTALAFAVVVVGGEVLQILSQGRGYWGEARWRWLEVAAATVAGVAVYLLSVRIVWWATGTDPLTVEARYRLTGGYPSTAGEIASALRYGLRMTGRFWFGGTTLYPLALKLVNLVLVAAGILAAMRVVGRAGWRTQWGAPVARTWMLLLCLGSLVVPFVVLFMREQPPTRGNVFTTVGLVIGFWAGLLLELAGADAPTRLGRRVETLGIALVLVAVLGCAYEVNKGYFGLYLSNQRDLANANRMLSVMEQMPQFGTGAEIKVELAGLARFAVPGEPFSNALGAPGNSIVNCSGLACQNRLVDMLNLIGGGDRAFVVRSVSRDPAVQAVLTTMPAWPQPGSIRFLEGVFVIKGSGVRPAAS